jgi:hypothetical protein
LSFQCVNKSWKSFSREINLKDCVGERIFREFFESAIHSERRLELERRGKIKESISGNFKSFHNASNSPFGVSLNIRVM